MAKCKKRKLHHPIHPPPRRADKSSRPAVNRLHEPTIPFNLSDRILLIGEGDFSFARSIVEHRRCCDVVATCLDSQAELFDKYAPQAEENVRFLEEEGQTVLYGIDATKLDQHKALRRGQGKGLERVVFNFPHVGGRSKDVNRQVRFNQELLVKFFAAALSLLSPEGAIVVTLFEGEPYTLWNIRDLARHSGLQVQRSFKFRAESYQGYKHARTLGNIEGGGGWKGEEREARSYIFVQDGQRSGSAPLGNGKVVGRKRKKGEESEESDGEG